MASLRKQLSRTFQAAFESLGFDASLGEVIVSDRPDLAQFQCNGALSAAKSQKKNPRDVATQILGALKFSGTLNAEDISLSLAGPGFINIKITDTLLARATGALTTDPRFGSETTNPPKTVMIDFGSPNVAKSMHVGHLRSTIIGDSLRRIFKFKGDKVIADNHLGDWGTPMGMLICEMKRRQPALPYFDEKLSGPYPKEAPVEMKDLEEMYPLAAAKFKEDENEKAAVLKATDELQKGRPGYKALWQHFVGVTIADLKKNYERLGVTYDTWLGESYYEEKMPPLVERLKKSGVAQLSDGAWIIPLNTVYEKEEIPPVILVKSGGGFLYHTSDLATIENHISEFGANLVLYVVDKRQSLHFKQIFGAAKLAGLWKEGVGLEHLPFGTMNGQDGKPFKTRVGGVLKLKDLMDMVKAEALKKLSSMGLEKELPASEIDSIAEKVGIATLKFADLKNHRISDYVFDLEKFSEFEGMTGPYLLYAAVRIKSILRKTEEAGLKPGVVIAPMASGPSGDAERKLMLELAKISDVIDRVYETREPHHLCQYGYDLCQVFNSFYKECHILREEDKARQASWITLSKLAHDEIIFALNLLGISVPERM